MSDDFKDAIPEQMERFSPAEADRYKTLLSSWNTLSQAHALMTQVGQRAQFYAVSQGELKFWREMFVGMSCAYLTHASRVRLGNDPPDFVLDYQTHEQAFELVQIVPGNYRVSGEHKTYAENLNRTGSTVIKMPTFEQNKAEYESFTADLEKGIGAKCNKYEDKSMILVADVMHAVYFESDIFAIRSAARIAKHGLSSFSEIWVRQSNHILRVSSQSISMISEPWPSEE